MDADKKPVGLFRLDEIIGKSEVTEKQAAQNRRTGHGPKRARAAIKGLLPLSRSAFYAALADGRFTFKPVKGICQRATFYRASDVLEFLAHAGADRQP